VHYLKDLYIKARNENLRVHYKNQIFPYMIYNKKADISSNEIPAIVRVMEGKKIT